MIEPIRYWCEWCQSNVSTYGTPFGISCRECGKFDGIMQAHPEEGDNVFGERMFEGVDDAPTR